MERMLGVMGDAQSEAEKQTIAPLVGKALGQVSEAFEQSTPQPQQMVRRRDALKPSQDGRMQRGIGQLRSLVQRMEGGSPSSEEDGAKQGREALANLQDGMRGQPGGGERHEQLLGQLEEVLSSLGEPGELENLKNMIAQLQSLAIEMGGQSAAVEQPEVTSIEPAKMAPAYRDRIQRYFEKLSEK